MSAFYFLLQYLIVTTTVSHNAFRVREVGTCLFSNPSSGQNINIGEFCKTLNALNDFSVTLLALQ